MEREDSGRLNIQTFGGLSIAVNGRPITNFVSAKAEALLVYLACNPRQHPRETLAELLWDDRTQRQAMSNLRTVLHSLRKEVGPFVTITRKTAAINLDSDLSVDARMLETAVAPGSIQSGEDAEVVEEALALYNGDFLAGFFLPEAAEFEGWAAAQRENSHRLFVEGSLKIGRYHLDQQSYPAAITTASRLLQIDPLAEAGHRQLMEALARNNQRAEALAQYEKCCHILDEELGLVPEEATTLLFETIRTDSLPGITPPLNEVPVYIPPKPTLPPQTTAILGREKERAELQQLLTNSAPLVTIVGPGGIGKTTLALSSAHNLADQYQDGAAFVSLAPLSSPDAVLHAVAKALRFEFLEQREANQKKELLNFLSQKKLLIILDNFEQLLDATLLLAEIVQSAPDVQLLITSRERLKLQVEQVYFLDGLACTNWQSIEEAREDSAVQLFVQHARRVRPTFSLRPDHLQPLQEIFRLVGGMPLAIILAAGWVEVLSPAEILSEIGRNLDILEATVSDIPDRHQSMRAVFDGTWNRLTDRDQQIFAALSIFKGGFTLEAAREVAQATPRDLMKLVDQSLVLRVENGRFELHELLRQFAFRELSSSPDREQKVCFLHSRYYCHFIQKREGNLKGNLSKETENEISQDLENIVTAWIWAVEYHQEFVFDAQSALGIYFEGVGRITDGEKAFTLAYSKIKKIKQPDPKRMAELSALTSSYTMYSSISLAKKYLNEASEYLKVAADLGNDIRMEQAYILLLRGQMSRYVDAETLSTVSASLALYQEINRSWEVGWVHNTLGHLNKHIGRPKIAIDHYNRSLHLLEMAGDRKLILPKIHLADCMISVGWFEEAEKTIRSAIQFAHEISDEVHLADALHVLGKILRNAGRFEEAFEALNRSYELYRTIGREHPVNESLMMLQASVSLHLGNYKIAKDISEAALNSASSERLNIRGLACLMFGYISLVQGGYAEAKNYLEESLLLNQKINKLDSIAFCNATLGIVATLTEDYTSAKHYITESLRSRLFTPFLFSIPAISLLFSREEKNLRALELYFLAIQYGYVANSKWFRDIVVDKLATLAATVSTETVAAAKEHGRSLDIWQTAESLLEELKGLPE